MDISLSTALSQQHLADQVDATLARKALDAQKLDGQNTLKLLDSAATAFSDPALGRRVNLSV